MNQQYDVVVVGLGAMGSAALYQLARRGARVLGIDQFAPPHKMGSTHGETRVTRLAVGEGAEYIPLVRRSHEIWHELEAQTGDKFVYLNGGYIIEPKENACQFHGAAGFVPRSAQLAKEHDIAHEVRAAAQIREHLPMLLVPDSSHAYYETTGGVVNPEGAVRAQLRMAERHGAIIQTGERVVTYQVDAQGVTVTSDKGTYHANKLVLAAGAWISDFLPLTHRAPFKVYRQVIYWFEVDELPWFDVSRFPFILWIGETLEDYYCLYPFIDGGTPGLKMMTEQYVDATHADSVSRTVQSHEIEQMYQQFIRRKIKGVTANCLQAAVCLYTVTPDEHFVIDFHPESKRVLVASPCSGHGFKHSAAIGESLAQMALTGKSEIDMLPFSFARFG